MASAREIRRRIKSVKNIAQVTRALQAVSASKARRAQEAVMATRAYARAAWKVLTDLSQQVGAPSELHPLFAQRPVKTLGLVLISGDRGLCGAFNYNLVRAALDFVKKQSAPVKVITVGKKGRELMWRRGFNIVGEYSGLPAAPSVTDVRAIAHAAIDGYMAGDFDLVYLVYAEYINTLIQKPVVKRLLPLKTTEVESQALSQHVMSAQEERV